MGLHPTKHPGPQIGGRSTTTPNPILDPHKPWWLRPPPSFPPPEASISVSNVLYRLATDSIVGELTRIRLADFSREAGYATCALRHPFPHPRYARRTTANSHLPSPTKTPHHISHINRILFNLNFSLDTDEINQSDAFQEIDCELADIIPISKRHKIMPLLGKYNLFFLSQLTSPDRLTLRPYAELRALLPHLPTKETQENTVWFPCLRETLTDSRNGPLNLLPQFIHSQLPATTHPAFHFPTTRGMQYRVDSYDLEQPTHNTTAIEAPGRPQVFTSDGSLKKLAD